MCSPHVVVMGPSGSGKSLVGAALAERLGTSFVDADDLHPPSNIQAMAAGTPLQDADRMPWLDLVAGAFQRSESGRVIACSALARRYRDRIRASAEDVVFVELLVGVEDLSKRMAAREHFMPPALLGSQLDALEHLAPDEAGIAVVNDRPMAEVVDEAVCALRAAQCLR